MANQNQLIVEVIGDTRKLTQGLATAQTQLKAFSSRTSTIHGRGADELLAQVRASRASADALLEQSRNVDAAAARTDATYSRMAKGGLIAGLAVNTLGRNLNDLGGTVGKVGNAISQLSTGNIVGFVKALQDNSAEVKKFEKDLLKSRDAAAAFDLANKLDAAGLHDLADAARAAAAGIREVTDAFVDNTKIRDSTSPGAIAADPTRGGIPKKDRKPKPLTPEQRRAFFDAGIARELDRVQDLKTVQQQVAALHRIEAEIQKRIDVTKDITRKLNLEDQLAQVRRQERGIKTQAAADAKSAAAERKRLADERARTQARIAAERKRRLEEAAAAAAARRQSRQSVALGEFTPSVGNLRKQLESLSARLADSGIKLSSKLQSNLEGARKVLAGQFGKATLESRDNIANLFETIRGEFDKQSKQGGGPLTKTTQLSSERILAGLGLGRDTERLLRARLSHFNSAGTALTGTGVGSAATVQVHSTVVVDGKAIAKASSKHQARARKVNPSQRNGPNQGLIVA